MQVQSLISHQLWHLFRHHHLPHLLYRQPPLKPQTVHYLHTRWQQWQLFMVIYCCGDVWYESVCMDGMPVVRELIIGGGQSGNWDGKWGNNVQHSCKHANRSSNNPLTIPPRYSFLLFTLTIGNLMINIGKNFNIPCPMWNTSPHPKAPPPYPQTLFNFPDPRFWSFFSS